MTGEVIEVRFGDHEQVTQDHDELAGLIQALKIINSTK